MQYLIIIGIFVLTLIILAFVYEFNIKKLKNFAKTEEESLNKLCEKYPPNIEICKYILKKLNNENVQIEEDNSNDDDDDNDEDEDDEDGSSYYTYDSDNGIYKFLSMFLVIFKWIGVAIAIILIAYFITQGNMKSLLMYIIGLVFAFFFGYFFMFILNKFTED